MTQTMTQLDRFEQPVSTTSTAAAHHYREALDLLFCMRAAARTEIETALEHDPEFALAHCVKARVEIIEGDSATARATAEQAVELATKATVRERQHAEIVARVTRNETPGTLAMVREHAQAYPRDALPLSFALGVYSLLGFGGFKDHHQQQVQLLEEVAPAWPQRDWWLQSWLGWSYVETGQLGRGIDLLDESLQARPDSANIAHGRAHGYYEAGDLQGGKQFLLDWMPGYFPHEPLHCHVAWHLALLYLQEGDFERAHALYDQHIRPQVSQALPMFTHIDCAAFAWRSQLYGCPLPSERLDELADFAQRHFYRPGIPFVNWHTALSNMHTGEAPVRQFASEVAEQAQQQGAEVTRVAAQLCDALAELAQGHAGNAAEQLQEALDEVACIGGSNAQRDGVYDTCIAAMLRAGRSDQAHALAAQRARSRASHLNEAWFGRLSEANPS